MIVDSFLMIAILLLPIEFWSVSIGSAQQPIAAIVWTSKNWERRISHLMRFFLHLVLLMGLLTHHCTQESTNLALQRQKEEMPPGVSNSEFFKSSAIRVWNEFSRTSDSIDQPSSWLEELNQSKSILRSKGPVPGEAFAWKMRRTTKFLKYGNSDQSPNHKGWPLVKLLKWPVRSVPDSARLLGRKPFPTWKKRSYRHGNVFSGKQW
jgi:hypothetical protein